MLSEVIISGILWDGIKKSISITKDYLREQTKEFIFEESEIIALEKLVSSNIEPYKNSERVFKAYIEENEIVNSIVSNYNKRNPSNDLTVNIQKIDSNHGTIIGSVKNYNESKK